MANRTKKNAPSEGARVQVAQSVSPAKEFAITPVTATETQEIAKQEIQVVAGEGYKDAYSKKEWPSRLAFYEMKQKQGNSNFTLLNNKIIEEIVKNISEGTKTFRINVREIGIQDHVDHRLAKYCLSFIRPYKPEAQGLNYKFKAVEVNGKKTLWVVLEAEMVATEAEANAESKVEIITA